MKGLRRLTALVAYQGGGFFGFQRQPGFPTIQEELERAWLAVSGERAVFSGSGRTDRGVHAWGQVVHWNTESLLPAGRIREALNFWLPREVVIRDAAEVGPDFHARRSAASKRYLFLLAAGPVRPVLRAGLVAWERADLDLAAMRAAAATLSGRHDFAAFAAAGGTARTTVRTLKSVHVRCIRGGLAFFFEGDGFLYRMVRNLVGTLLEVGRGKRAPEWAGAVLESRDRRRAGATAPPEGLYLWRVCYPRDPFRGPSSHCKDGVSWKGDVGDETLLSPQPRNGLMNIEITNRSEEIPDALRAYALERLSGVERLGEEFVKGEIILSLEKEELLCDVILHRHRGEPFLATGQSREGRTAVDDAAAKLEKQFVRFKEKHSTKARRRQANR